MEKKEESEIKKIPFFVHYPKCGGSSVSVWLRQYLFFFKKNKSLKKELVILDETKRPILAIFISFNKEIKEPYLLKTRNEKIIGIYLSDLYSFLSKYKIKIHYGIIKTAGVKFLKNGLYDDIIKKFYKNYSIKYFLSFREPLEREISLFYYLNSERSEKELTHKAFGDISFEDYIKNIMPDSWLLTTLSGKNSYDLKNSDYRKCINFLKNFFVFEINDLEKGIRNFISTIENNNNRNSENFLQEIFKNKYNVAPENQKKLIHHLSEESQNLFKEKKFFEYKIYSLLKKNSLKYTF
jgi:hypothetical protein